MLDYALAQQGFADDEDVDDCRAHFTNSAPAIADVDGDGTSELSCSARCRTRRRTERERGVALCVFRPDGTRPAAWVAPFHVPAYLSGLWDLGDNIVAATNQVAVAELDTARPRARDRVRGLRRAHPRGRRPRAASCGRTSTRPRPTSSPAASRSATCRGDGRPEIVFATYSTDAGTSDLFVLDARGNRLHRSPLPDRGAMAVPTLADVERQRHARDRRQPEGRRAERAPGAGVRGAGVVGELPAVADGAGQSAAERRRLRGLPLPNPPLRSRGGGTAHHSKPSLKRTLPRTRAMAKS